MTADLTFYWERDPTQRGTWWSLYDKPKGEPRWPIGYCHSVADFDADASGRKKVWRASVYGGGGVVLTEPPFATAGSSAAAMRALERECDKRSIGLWGVDVIEFVRVDGFIR